MKWEDLRRSSNVQDFRASSGGGRGNSRLVIYLIRFLIGNKYGRIILVIGFISYLLGYNPLVLLSFLDAPKTTQEKDLSHPSNKQDNITAEFVSVILAQNEDIWHKLFIQSGKRYIEPNLVLFRGSVNSGCGYATKQTGPFYCSKDSKIYLDMSFFDELKNRHNSPGDFAQAYVISHEVGHHVQNLLGTLNKSHKEKALSSKTEANAVQVKVELQADCYAGIWAHYVSDVIEEGDIEEALNAASAIGDDTLQKKAKGYVVPDAFTHGSSKDRMAWFSKGYKYGDLSSCQTGI